MAFTKFPSLGIWQTLTQAWSRPAVGVHDWHIYRHFNGWAQASSLLAELAHRECHGGTLRVGTASNLKNSVVYLYTCAFANSHGCKWGCRVKLTKQQHRDDPVAVGIELRAAGHAHHAGWMETSNCTHVDHRGRQLNTNGGSELLMVTAMQQNDMMYWNKEQIGQWLIDEKVQVRSDDAMRQLVKRTKRFTENYRNRKAAGW